MVPHDGGPSFAHEQSQSLENSLFGYGKEDSKRAQMEIVGGEVNSRASSGAASVAKFANPSSNVSRTLRSGH